MRLKVVRTDKDVLLALEQVERHLLTGMRIQMKEVDMRLRKVKEVRKKLEGRSKSIHDFYWDGIVEFQKAIFQLQDVLKYLGRKGD